MVEKIFMKWCLVVISVVRIGVSLDKSDPDVMEFSPPEFVES